MSGKRTTSEPVKQAVSTFLAQHPFKHYTLAFSGGLDSCVLLHALSQSIPPSSIHAVYIDHQLQAESTQWTQVNKALCDRLKVPFSSYLATVNTNKSSLESQARQARYELLWSAVEQTTAHSNPKQTQACLLTAHHLNDNAENFFVRLMRGAGVKGLASMSAMKSVKQGRFLARPLLGLSRQELEHYAAMHELSYISDPSNQDTQHRRNFIRHHIIPQLETVWPQAIQRIDSTMQHLSQADELLNDIAREDLDQVLITTEVVDVAILQTLSRARQDNVVRFWLEQLHEAMPTSDVLAQIHSQLIAEPNESNKTKFDAVIRLHKGTLRGYRNRVFYLHNSVQRAIDDLYADIFLGEPVRWNISEPLRLSSALELNQDWFKKHYPQHSSIETLELALRQNGDNKRRVHLSGHQHSKQLKNYIQELDVVPWLRSKVILVCHEAQIIGVIVPTVDYGARSL